MCVALSKAVDSTEILLCLLKIFTPKTPVSWAFLRGALKPGFSESLEASKIDLSVHEGI